MLMIRPETDCRQRPVPGGFFSDLNAGISRFLPDNIREAGSFRRSIRYFCMSQQITPYTAEAAVP